MNTELRKNAKNDFISIRKLYEYWCDDMKTKYGDRVKLCYMDMDSFIMQIKTEDFYRDIANDVEEKYDTSNYTCERPLPIGKNKKSNWFNEG